MGVAADSGVGDGSTGILPVGPTGSLPVVGGVSASPDVGTGVGDADFFGDGVGDAFDFFFADGPGDAFAFFFFFFDGVGVFFGVVFFFFGDAFGFGLGDLRGLGEAWASGVCSDETWAEAGVRARTLATSDHKQKRTTAHLTRKNFRRAEAPEPDFPARVRGAESRSIFRLAIATDRSDTSRSAE